jgi:hypothetical protein
MAMSYLAHLNKYRDDFLIEVRLALGQCLKVQC